MGVSHALPLNEGLVIRWDSIPSAVSYEWSVNDGAAWHNYTPVPNQSHVVKVFGLVNEMPYTVRVRGISASGPLEPSNPVVAIPSSSRFVTHFDDFDRPSSATSIGTPVVGSPYTPGLGNWGISTNQFLYMSTNTDNGRVFFPSTSNFDVEFKNVGMTNSGLVFRASDTQNFWALSFESGTGWGIWDVVSGNWERHNQGFSRGELPYDTIRVVARGQEIFFYRNGRVVLTMYDTKRVTASTLGFFADEHTNAKIDDVIVWTVTDDSFYGNLSGGTAHVYKGHDRHSEDTGDIP